MEFLSYAIPVALGIAVSGSSYIVHKVVELDKKLTAHETADSIVFSGFKEDFAEVKQTQRDQMQKIDRLVEHLLPKR